MSFIALRDRTWWYVTALVSLSLAFGPSPVAAQGATVPAARLDLTGNGVINAADAWRVVDAWNQLQTQGTCLSPDFAASDVDASGCVDVGDLQKVLAQFGSGTSAAVAPQGAGLAAVGSTYVVNSTLDGDDTTPGDGVCRTAKGVCSFKAAVQETNAHPGRDTITFGVYNPDGTCPAGPVILSPTTNVSTTLTLDDRDNAGTVINGYSQCGASPNTLQIGSDAQLKIELKGLYKAGVNGLVMDSSNNEVRGLAIYNWDANILVTANARNNVIAGNYLGTNNANTFFKTVKGQNLFGNGLNIRYYATDTIVGGTDPGSRNVISGAGADGVASDETSIGSKVWNNYIGLKKDGMTQLSNNSDGMDFDWGSAHNYIGGTEPGQGNVISGNKGDGIELSHIRVGKVSEDNHVLGNIIGLSATGGPVLNASTGLPNAWGNGGTGVTLEDNQHTVEIAYNYLSNNGNDGARIYFHGIGCSIHDNIIGLGTDGKTRYPNGLNADLKTNHNNDGIWIVGDVQHTLIARNIITASKGNGILISNRDEGTAPGQYRSNNVTDWNTITQNKIYGNDGSVDANGKPLDTTHVFGGDSGIRFEVRSGAWPNMGIKIPIISDASTQAATGSACPNCTVEVFITDKTSLNDVEKSGEGKTFIGSAVANAGGVFLVKFSQTVSKGAILTATATDLVGNTSMFAKNIAIGDSTIVLPTPIPSDTPVPSPTDLPTATVPTAEPTAPSQPDPTATDGTLPDQPTITPTTSSGIDPTQFQYHSWVPVVVK